MILGTVIKCLGGLYTVRLDNEQDGEKYATLRGRGAFRHEKTVLLAGDRVELEKTAEGSFFPSKILPRKNALIRPPLANLDYIFIVISSKKPTPSLFIVDKMISIAEHNKIKPVIVISKSDLDGDYAAELYGIYKRSGFDVFITSSQEREGVGALLDFLREITKNSDPVCAFAGASGAGKSTLMNVLFPSFPLKRASSAKK